MSLIMGLLLQKHADSLLKRINLFILYVPLPATILLNIPKIQWSLSTVPIMMTSWVVFACACLFFITVGRLKSWEPKLIVCLILTAGLGNTSFVGYPIICALYGEEAIKFAVLIDQPGTFMICSTFGVFLATKFSTPMPILKVIRKILIFPPFIAFVLSLMMGSRLAPMDDTLRILGWLLPPLAFISVGLQLNWKAMMEEATGLKWGLGFKLILAPIIIFLTFRFFDVSQEVFRVMVLEAAMAPMITSSILAATNDLHPRLAGVMVGVGVPISFLTLFAWYQLL
jgi:predicted permease